MNSESSRPLPFTFVDSHVHLLPAELAAGYRLGYVDEWTVVKLAERVFAAGNCQVSAIEELALLLSDDLDRVPALVAEVETETNMTDAEERRVWLFLVLQWVYEHREISADPMGDLEKVYADFDYPQEMEPFVPFMPAPAGKSSGPEAIEERLRAYLDSRSREYSQRSSQTRPRRPALTRAPLVAAALSLDRP